MPWIERIKDDGEGRANQRKGYVQRNFKSGEVSKDTIQLLLGYYLAGATVVHCAEAIFHLPELCTNTTVVASLSFSLAVLLVRMPVRTAVSPKRRTDTSLKVRLVCGSSFACLPALGSVFDQMNPTGITRARLSISI